MVIRKYESVAHDFVTKILCDGCAERGFRRRNMGEVTIRRLAQNQGWLITGDKDICPECRAKMEG